MNRILEIAAMALGGVSLFAVCFLGFAAMAGVPMSDVAVVGKLFPEPPEPQEAAVVEGEAAAPARVLRDDARVYESSLGVLGAWSLASPFSADELKGLADELKLKRLQLSEEIEEMDRREAALDAREEALAEQFEALDELRARLEAYEAELLLRAQEVERDEAVRASANDRKYENLAALFGGLEPAEAGRRLAAYPPAEATRILLHLDDKRAREVLNTFQGDQYLAYAQAWAEAAGVKR
jgi:flagellar motility protein MotE (MotC chaperone)